MRGIVSTVFLLVLGVGAEIPASVAQTADIEWEVQNPFRFYKRGDSFQLHEKAYKAVRGAPESPLPNNIIQLTERCLNDPNSKEFPVAPACAELSHGLSSEEKRIGWAAHTLSNVCYERGKREYPITCEREHDGRMEQEDYILPQSHTVEIGLTDKVPAEEKNGSCEWQWSERADPSRKTTHTAPCGEKVVINKVPFALRPAPSGIDVTVKLSSGRVISEPAVAVDDVLVVALGDSFSSGEGNPDLPVKFSRRGSLEYGRIHDTPVMSSSLKTARLPEAGLDKAVTSLLPRREIESDLAGNVPDQATAEFENQFWKKSAKWLSADCHRSQYGYPVRVALQLSLEDRHRAITFVHLGCSGAEVTDGLLGQMDAREGVSATQKVKAQLAQLADLLCRKDSPRNMRTFMLPVFDPGNENSYQQPFTFSSCRGKLKRPIDIMLLSIGGNDVGFSALGAYVILTNVSDIAWVGNFVDKKMRYGPKIADAHLNVLDRRIQAIKVALEEDFAVSPSKVVHTSYEPIQYDEMGKLCGNVPKLGMDVHEAFSFHVDKLDQTAKFLGRLLDGLQCMTNKAKAESNGLHCPGTLKTGEGTKFTLVADHQGEFRKRGICARGPGDGSGGALMYMPRDHVGEFRPYNPADFYPYASRARLFRTPNDAFLIANSHLEGKHVDDLLQSAFAALYSGAIHPTAQAHATVADYVVKEAREILKKDSR
jgi:hypothetical protein